MDEETVYPSPNPHEQDTSDNDLTMPRGSTHCPCESDNALVNDKDWYYNGPPLKSHWLHGRRFYA